MHLLFKLIDRLQSKRVFCVGQATAKVVQQYGVEITHVASPETAEGVVSAFEKEPLEGARIFWPKAAGARRVINDFFEQHQNPLMDCVLYHTKLVTPNNPPSLDDID